MASDKPKKEIRTMKKTNGKKKVDIEPIEYSTEAQPRETTQDGVPVFCAFDKIAPLTELNPNPGNPNTHDDRQVALLAEIIKATGWRAPITVSKRSGLITKGHGRRLAAIHAGLQFAPVEFQDYASEEEEHADLVADNRIAELSIIDTGKLVDMLQEMDTGAVPLELTGYGAEDLENLLAALEGANDTEDDGADAGTETPTVPIAKMGDVWSLGRHRLICGSSTDRATLERLMDGAKAQMVHTDPPYGVSFIGSGRGTNKFGMIQNDDLRSDELVKDLLAPAFKNIFDFTEDDAGIYIWYATASVRDFLDAMTIAGIVNKQQIIWVKNDFVIGHNDYQWAHEPCFYCEKAGQHAAFFGDRGQWTTWKVSLRAAEGLSTTLTGGVTLTDGKGHRLYMTDKPPKGKKTRYIRVQQDRPVEINADGPQGTIWEAAWVHGAVHPNQKPLELPSRAIANSSQPGDIVLDIFCGSGSTLIAAEQLGRTCYGVELDPKYIDVIVERFQKENDRAQITCSRDGKKFTLEEIREQAAAVVPKEGAEAKKADSKD